MAPEGWSGVAFNPATESENKIHADDVAKTYGFRGGLVPGVTVFALMAHPALVAWGRDWLERGFGKLVLSKPLYDGDRFVVDAKAAGENGYAGTVTGRDVVCSEGAIELSTRIDDMPARRGDALVGPSEERPDATREALERLRDEGMRAIRRRWSYDGEQSTYLADPAGMHETVRDDGDGLANPGFVLCQANWVLAMNVRLGPWIHVQSEIQNRRAVRLGQTIVTEAVVTDLFDKRGNEFADLDVCSYLESGEPVMRARHRAIYVLRPR